MEIQREKGHDLQESIERNRRINFYMRLGAKVLDGVNYLLPPLQHGADAERMYLMIRPLVDVPYLSKEYVLRCVKAIYSTIYKYKDRDLLYTVAQKIPEKVFLHGRVI